ncbi:signal-regulatory protein beta-2-like isoform X2 [Eleginops maclovinus]|uniref:signal-regulatory protein beta-2-like isoform X2 n=1 Tax=Eleginops maclovinus TaxID=56733 RepID=UPI0030810D26
MSHKSHLSISATTWKDVGTYFCGVVHLNEIQFGSGTFLMLKGAHMISESVIQQPESNSVQPGDSVSLSCSHTGYCAAEQSIVTWLKNSRHSAPEMIYFSRNGICQKKDSGKTTCVYGLLLRNFSSEDAATYYCVVTSCGQTLFGSGTRIYIQGKTFESQLNPTTIALGLSNIALGIMTVILVYTLCRRRGSTASTDGSSEGHQTSDVVTYTDPISLPRRQPAVRYCKGSVLYSEVRNCQPN